MIGGLDRFRRLAIAGRFAIVLIGSSLVSGWAGDGAQQSGEQEVGPDIAEQKVGSDIAEQEGGPDGAEGRIGNEQSGESESANVVDQVQHARHVIVPLPIVGSVDVMVRERIARARQALPAEQPRPVLILEFRRAEDESADSSWYERSLALARYLSSDAFNGIRTVAYLPGSVKGHAVLPVIACEELVMHPDAELGAAGIQEKFIDQEVRAGYAAIAAKRRTIPLPLVLGMLDRDLSVLRVRTPEGARYVLGDDLPRLEQETAVGVRKTIVARGDFGLFTGRELRLDHALVSHLANDANDVVSELKLPQGSFGQISSDSWNSVLAEIKGPVNTKSVSWVISSLQQQTTEANFVCVLIDSAGGAPEESIRLAQWLADQQDRGIKTVAFIPREARADAILIALGCDELVVGREARLGGPGAALVDDSQRDALLPALRGLGVKKQRDWSLYCGLMDGEFEVARYTRDNGGDQVRYLSDRQWEDLDDKDQWNRGAVADLSGGISGQEAETYHLSNHFADSVVELQAHYGLSQAPRKVERNWAHDLVERLASPGLSRTLLFFAFFSLMIELTNPGLSVAGFISGLCFMLFFWSQFLHGTAGWLEILLFIAGVACVLVEIFLVPGIGAFGIGGCVMIIASIVLASQTFVVPRNQYQLAQLPTSLSAILASGAGVIVSIFMIRRFLPHTPFLRNVMLPVPDEKRRAEIDHRERLVDYEHLMGKRGTTTTQLTPSGKARFGDDVVAVISNAELIPKGSAVYVAEIRGSHVIVDRIPT